MSGHWVGLLVQQSIALLVCTFISSSDIIKKWKYCFCVADTYFITLHGGFRELNFALIY